MNRKQNLEVTNNLSLPRSGSGKRVFVWLTGLDDFLVEQGNVGGITLQMYFWSRTFAAIGWQVESLTVCKGNDKRMISGIFFTQIWKVRWLSPLLEIIKIFQVVTSRPDLILHRGAGRTAFVLALLSRIWRVKLILLFASDSDLMPRKELIARKWDQILWRYGIRLGKYFVCQNEQQTKLLKSNYHLKANFVMIPNIWLSSNYDIKGVQDGDMILWVANFRNLKRPEMFLNLAKQFPSEHFVMAGGEMNDNSFQTSKVQAQKISNLSFLGPISFAESQQQFAQAKLFVCTSEMEGFPNTFLQAFSQGIPVLTTFDPCGIVDKYCLGMTVHTQQELIEKLDLFFKDAELRRKLRYNVKRYFEEHYSSDEAISKLLQMTKVNLQHMGI